MTSLARGFTFSSPSAFFFPLQLSHKGAGQKKNAAAQPALDLPTKIQQKAISPENPLQAVQELRRLLLERMNQIDERFFNQGSWRLSKFRS